MPNLLYQVRSMRVFTGEIHPSTLNVYDDYMVYVKRGIIWRNEATISYNHVSQVYLRVGYIAASLEIINTGGVENILIPWLPKEKARKAKRLIDQKIYHTHARLTGKDISIHKDVPDVERKIARLKELLLKGDITKSEFEKKKREMLKSM